MSIHVFIYGIVMIEIYIHNKEVTALYTVVTFTYHIPRKCAKTRKPKDEHFVLQYNYVRDNKHDPIPPDKLKNHTALPYITWGLIWDTKIKRKESLR